MLSSSFFICAQTQQEINKIVATYEGKTSENDINVSKLNTGVYILEVTDRQKTLTKKFIKK